MFTSPLNFVIPKAREWPELQDGTFLEMSDEARTQRSVSGLDNWIILPYQYFRAAGANVTHSAIPKPGVINIAAGRDLAIRDRGIAPFVVICRADAHPPQIANFIIEQNGLRAGAPRTACLPHPPQPALIPRDPSRQGLSILAYKGAAKHLEPDFKDEAFCARLIESGVTLRIDDYADQTGEPAHAMHDFHAVDAVLAVRNITESDAVAKPANKLVNAWRAGVPAILGPEPAYQELRRSELDYIEVKSGAEALTALARLAADPALYAAMIENGHTRAEAYTEEQVYGLWPDVFNGPVQEEFERWSRLPYPAKAVFFARGALAERRARETMQRNARTGKRILEG